MLQPCDITVLDKGRRQQLGIINNESGGKIVLEQYMKMGSRSQVEFYIARPQGAAQGYAMDEEQYRTYKESMRSFNVPEGR